MTEKRFKRFCIADGFKIVAIKDNDKIMNSNQVCNKLNELYEENEQLNNENKSFKAEIEQLKKCYNNVLNEMDTLAEVNDQTYKENKGLKKELDSFNPVVFNDMIKGTVILYSKGDVE